MQRRKPVESRELFLKALGKRIRALRLEANIAQEVFAYEAGIDRSYYGKIERGDANPTAINLAKIAITLGVEVGTLFPSRDEAQSLLETPEQKEAPE
jgi:transcriptional regulator with XRE-family HTH domain